MAAKKQRGSIETSSALELKLDTAISTIEGVSLQLEKAIKLRARESRKYMKLGQKLRSRRSRLLKKKIVAQGNVNKLSNAKTRTALKWAAKDLAAIDQEIADTRAARAAVLSELKQLRALRKQARAYFSVIRKAKKALKI